MNADLIFIYKPSKATLASYRKQGARIECIEFDWVKVTLNPNPNDWTQQALANIDKQLAKSVTSESFLKGGK